MVAVVVVVVVVVAVVGGGGGSFRTVAVAVYIVGVLRRW